MMARVSASLVVNMPRPAMSASVVTRRMIGILPSRRSSMLRRPCSNTMGRVLSFFFSGMQDNEAIVPRRRQEGGHLFIGHVGHVRHLAESRPGVLYRGMTTPPTVT